MDHLGYNRDAWDHQVAKGNEWTRPVSKEKVDAARRGEWEVVLTGGQSVPREWFGEISGANVLCLASGGGQQAPILAAAGANVTCYDLSPAQLAQDRKVAEENGLQLETVEGSMDNLDAFADERFDLIFHPVSNCFIPDVNPLWREAFRVLKPGGRLLAGFINPAEFIFDYKGMQEGRLEVRHTIPFSDAAQLTEAELAELRADDEPLTFGHSLGDQLGGQCRAGFVIADFFENKYEAPLSNHLPTYIATLALKQARP